VAARVHVPDTYDVPETNDADADTDDAHDAGPCEDVVVLARTHRGPCEDKVVLAKTYSGASEDSSPCE